LAYRLSTGYLEPTRTTEYYYTFDVSNPGLISTTNGRLHQFLTDISYRTLPRATCHWSIWTSRHQYDHCGVQCAQGCRAPLSMCPYAISISSTWSCLNGTTEFECMTRSSPQIIALWPNLETQVQAPLKITVSNAKSHYQSGHYCLNSHWLSHSRASITS